MKNYREQSGVPPLPTKQDNVQIVQQQQQQPPSQQPQMIVIQQPISQQHVEQIQMQGEIA